MITVISYVLLNYFVGSEWSGLCRLTDEAMLHRHSLQGGC